MKKALFILILLSFIVVITGCSVVIAADEKVGEMQQKENFNFIFTYGVTGGNILDTFQGTYTKDMILSPSITINLVLSAEEMDTIHQKMMEIDFFNYPDEFKVNVTGDVIIITPHPNYSFKVKYEFGVKVLKWEDDITNPDAQAEKLRELINLIKSIIESKPEYQALPMPNGGYL